MASSGAVRRLAHNIAKQHFVSRQGIGAAQQGVFWNATFVASETFDANCSQIQIAGNTMRGVPRLATGAAWPPAAGTNLLVLQMGSSFLILGAISGRPILSPLLGAGG